jgi:predicted ester cyclase
MPTNYPTLVHEWFEEVWNQGNARTIDRLLAENAVVHGLTDENGRELVGPKAFKEFHRRYLDAFPGVRVEVADIIVQGDKMAARCIVRGRHLGNGLGIEATRKETEFTGMCIARVQGGKIVEAWNNFDFLTMHSQLGTLDKLGR